MASGTPTNIYTLLTEKMSCPMHSSAALSKDVIISSGPAYLFTFFRMWKTRIGGSNAPAIFLGTISIKVPTLSELVPGALILLVVLLYVGWKHFILQFFIEEVMKTEHAKS